jgi:small GTP-binding protein
MAASDAFDFKVVFVGNSGSGKSSLVQAFCSGRFPESPARTLASQFHEHAVDIPDYAEPVDLMLWDTPGREALRALAADAYAGCNLCVAVYSVADRASFEAVPQWAERVKAVAAGVPVVVVEAQIDLIERARVDAAEAQRMAAQLDAPLFRVSAREGVNVRSLFVYLATALQGRFLKSLSSLPLGAEAFFVASADDAAPPGAPPPPAAADPYCAVA